MNENENLRKVLDRSGFPLQVRLEKITDDAPNWNVDGNEIYWERDNYSGFIDTVYSGINFPKKVISEVKKTSGGEWIFLLEKNDGSILHNFIALSSIVKSSSNLTWDTSATDHTTHRSSFCIVNGQDKNRPMLEGLCTNLLIATEAFAKKDIEEIIKENRGVKNLQYIPVIITNTPLYICKYDSSAVNLKTGIIDGDAEFERVDSVAFQKPLKTTIGSEDINDLASNYKYNKAQDRTVFVVHSTAFASFLNDLDPNIS